MCIVCCECTGMCIRGKWAMFMSGYGGLYGKLPIAGQTVTTSCTMLSTWGFRWCSGKGIWESTFLFFHSQDLLRCGNMKYDNDNKCKIIPKDCMSVHRSECTRLDTCSVFLHCCGDGYQFELNGRRNGHGGFCLDLGRRRGRRTCNPL